MKLNPTATQPNDHSVGATVEVPPTVESSLPESLRVMKTGLVEVSRQTPRARLITWCLWSLLLLAPTSGATGDDNLPPPPQQVLNKAPTSPWPWLSPDSSHQNILRLLRWYNSSAIGALTPLQSITFPLSEVIAPLRELDALKCVEKRWIIDPKYRNALYWGESRSGESEISLFPFQFSIEEIVATETRPSPIGESLAVSFKWRAVGFNELARKLLNTSNSLLSVTVRDSESIIGQTGLHSLPLFMGEFGYYRPITREPLTKDTECEDTRSDDPLLSNGASGRDGSSTLHLKQGRPSNQFAQNR